MLVNTSYNDKKTTSRINEILGRPFSILENFKLNGIGSPRLIIVKSSEQIHQLLSLDHNLNWCNIELRPKGIIIGFRSLLESYSLVIPYYKLVIYKPGNSYTFHIDQHYITVDNSIPNKKFSNFMEKLMRLKTENLPTSIDEL
ncbi:hypothetical protein [Flavobacterium sp.]|uniref:hypothetical protein n=1 Tax=Flavobacterium sp. TaxID=239 RepID=UPI002FD9D7C1